MNNNLEMTPGVCEFHILCHLLSWASGRATNILSRVHNMNVSQRQYLADVTINYPGSQSIMNNRTGHIKKIFNLCCLHSEHSLSQVCVERPPVLTHNPLCHCWPNRETSSTLLYNELYIPLWFFHSTLSIIPKRSIVPLSFCMWGWQVFLTAS